MDDLEAVRPEEEQQDGREPSEQESDELYRRLKAWFLKDSAHSEEWRDQARKDFDFVAGDQWETNDFNRMLNNERRQPITFNKTQTFIKMVAGLEINGRHEIIYLPRGTSEGEIVLNENLTQASKWLADNCDAESEQSRAFEDMTTCGMGWTEERIDLEDEEDGKYVLEAVDPLDMYWDKAARKRNIRDAQRVARVKKMRLADAQALAQQLGANVGDDELDAYWATGVDQKANKPYEEVRLKTGAGNANAEGAFELDPNSEVHIVQYQWWERETFIRVVHPHTGEEIKLSPNEFSVLMKQAKRANVTLKYVRQTRKVFKQAFVGGCILGGVQTLEQGRFTLQCLTGPLHKSKGTFYGLVKSLRDPQMWSNKMFSQVLHILNTTAKGGIIAEAKAFRDIREAQRTFARPDAITIVEDGAIANGRIMAKPGAGIAAPFINMMQIADANFYTTTGLNIETMGMKGEDQPGILEAQRKQAGMTVLATLFDARRDHLKQVGRNRLYFIQTHLSDGRIVRIVDPRTDAGYRAIALMHDRVAGEYDVEVKDAPTSPDQKNQTWQMLMQLLPFFKGSMTPQIAAIFLQYSPLPSNAVNDLKQAMSAPNPQAEEQKQIAQQHAAAKIDSEKARAEQSRASARRDDAASAADIANAVLDIAQAGGQLQAQQAANAEQQLLAMLGAKRPAPVGNDQYAVIPEQVANPANALPQLPQLPAFGQQRPGAPGVPPEVVQMLKNPAFAQQLMSLIQQQQASAQHAEAA